jgi:hypothetical protein
MITAEHIKRVQKEYSAIAGEPVEVQQISGAVYVFGSEIATLRLFRKMPHIRQGYSENRATFYCSIELKF